jgi:predicted NUDIX family NTP pyrophosphohydrolase
MPRLSAGIVLYRKRGNDLELFLVHPGGPFWKSKDEGAWSFPKGEYSEPEDPLEVAKREFLEETGSPIDGTFLQLTPRKQKGGKVVSLWAVEGDCDARAIRSNTFAAEWPPRSGKFERFPEVDRAAWFPPQTAKEKINPGQAPAIDELLEKLGLRTP